MVAGVQKNRRIDAQKPHRLLCDDLLGFHVAHAALQQQVVRADHHLHGLYAAVNTDDAPRLVQRLQIAAQGHFRDGVELSLQPAEADVALPVHQFNDLLSSLLHFHG